MASADPGPERLYDYTKFHIGIYILAASSMITVAATHGQSPFLDRLVKHPPFLLAAIASLAVAGTAGGVIISRSAVAATLGEVWEKRIGPWGLELMTGRAWGRLEHAAFWIAVVLFAVAALWP